MHNLVTNLLIHIIGILSTVLSATHDIITVRRCQCNHHPGDYFITLGSVQWTSVAIDQLGRLQLVQSAAARLITGPYYTSLATSSAMYLVQASCLDV